MRNPEAVCPSCLGVWPEEADGVDYVRLEGPARGPAEHVRKRHEPELRLLDVEPSRHAKR